MARPADERGLKRPSGDEPLWLDLDGSEAAAASIEVRESAIDREWTPWNLAEGAFTLLGNQPVDRPPRLERRLRVGEVGLSRLPRGVEGFLGRGEVRFRTPWLQVGFGLGRPGFSFLAIDDEGRGAVHRNLLFQTPGIELQGPMLHPVGEVAAIAPALRCDIEGSVEVQSNQVRYSFAIPPLGQHIELAWTVEPDAIELVATRRSERDVRAWESALWQMGLDLTVAATATLGAVERRGRTGVMPLPVLVHVPGHGSLRVDTDCDGVSWRSEADRPRGWTLGELKLGERQMPEGDHLLAAGRHTARVTWKVATPGVAASPGAPVEVTRALRRVAITGLPYRPDTATLSNNGGSMHCPLSMDGWAAVATRLGEVTPGVEAADLLRCSLERWLDGGPGYGSGDMGDPDDRHLAEDEYVYTGAAAILGLAKYLEYAGTPEWVAVFASAIGEQLRLLRSRDVDGDGLVESRYRRGVSGEHQWSTNWYDAVSSGWKDAFVNALLHSALRILARQLPLLGASDLAGGLDAWADDLREAYAPTFLNPETGWVAGWRSSDGCFTTTHISRSPAPRSTPACSRIRRPNTRCGTSGRSISAWEPPIRGSVFRRTFGAFPPRTWSWEWRALPTASTSTERCPTPRPATSWPRFIGSAWRRRQTGS